MARSSLSTDDSYNIQKSKDKIIIRGARQHNLKNINLDIPRDKFVVITGLSGSGKSSLAFDTIYAEGQRRYIESLSAYARQFLGQMDKPDVDYIEGLSPAISIEQRTAAKNPRSTVATVTEIHDYLRLLFARIGIPHCPNCHKRIAKQTVDQMVDQVMKLKEGTKIQVLSPLIKAQKGEHKEIFKSLKKEGYSRVRVDGRIRELEEEEIKLEKNKKHTIEVVVDRVVVKPGIEKRLADSIQTALEHSKGTVVFDINEDKDQEITLSESMACPTCGFSLEELSPRMFSFNSPFGACKQCLGLGYLLNMDPDLVIPDRTKSISEGAIVTMPDTDSWSMHRLSRVADEYGFNLDIPINKMKKEHLKILLYGDGSQKQRVRGYHGWYHSRGWEGVLPQMERRYLETESEYMKEWYAKYMSNQRCPSCNGERFKPEILAVTINEKSISQVSQLSIRRATDFFSNLELTEKERLISSQILKEIKSRLSFLMNVGLDYLTLDRAAASLSGGEAQRIQLATQIGSSLVGVLYILDEPSIGLHQRDNRKLISTLKALRDIGNTVLVVEHDEETILESDFVVDLGPGAGLHGGYVVATGTPEQIRNNQQSITGRYLSGARSIPVPQRRRTPSSRYLVVKGARENNLKNIDAKFPLGVFTCVTGLSGSGKSSLVNDILYRALAQKLYYSREKPGVHDKILGVENIDKAIIIDQSPIGRTPRSNPATYVGLFTDIRDLFTKLPDAQARGYKPGRFSFNVKGGRCEACEGDGIIRLEMHFLPDVYVPCEVCKGKRYNRETLEIKYKGKSIAEVLELTVEEGLSFFENIPKIKRRLETLNDVGLGYVQLGQSATTLSGGEAQRVKLASELSKRPTGKTLYLLDEPTTGLHFEDIKKLLGVLGRLTDAGNTIIVIEHNLDVIKTADWILDLGPEGGERGGRIVAEGTPEEVAMVEGSFTGEFLKHMLFPNEPSKESRDLAKPVATASSINAS
ncbi:MAG: excinuclease ABC subunit UvrA [Nitrososphaerota archaeon]|nr:excinuclease ABC subunit UvrA [Nitrososphaerota archaeon]